jgi:hypothetical protein
MRTLADVATAGKGAAWQVAQIQNTPSGHGAPSAGASPSATPKH